MNNHLKHLAFWSFFVLLSLQHCVKQTDSDTDKFTSLKKNIIKAKDFKNVFTTLDSIMIDTQQPIGEIYFLCSFGHHGKMVIYDHSQKQLFLLDNNGSILQKIGQCGEGPDEYQGIISFDCDQQKRIFVLENPTALKRIKIYSETGTLQETLKIPVKASVLRVTANCQKIILYDTEAFIEGTKNTHILDIRTGKIISFGCFEPIYKNFNIPIKAYLNIVDIDEEGFIYTAASPFSRHFEKFDQNGHLVKKVPFSNTLPYKITTMDEFGKIAFEVFKVNGIYCYNEFIILAKMQNKANYIDIFTNEGKPLKSNLRIPENHFLLEVDQTGIFYFVKELVFDSNNFLLNPMIIKMKFRAD